MAATSAARSPELPEKRETRVIQSGEREGDHTRLDSAEQNRKGHSRTERNGTVQHKTTQCVIITTKTDYRS